MLLTIVVFFIVLGVLIFVHELGHYWTARMFKVKSEEFGFGLPPRICGWRKKDGKRKFFWGNKEVEKIDSDDTVWSLNWLPLGGFVKIKGEDGENKDNDSFSVQKAWKRVIILSAGVFMNFVLAVVLLSIVLMIGAPQIIEDLNGDVVDQKIQVLQVLPGSPADESGLQMGDVILSIDDQEFAESQDVADYISSKKGESINLSVMRMDEEVSLSLIPKYNEESERAIMGASLIKSGIVKYPWYQSIWLGLKSTVIMTVTIVVAFYNIIKNLLIGMPAGVEVAGPIGIAVMSGQAARMGIVYILQFTALLSINLAIINFVPFPALDGGRVLFIVIEKIIRRPINQKVEGIIHAVGFFILIALMIIITGRDIFINLFG